MSSDQFAMVAGSSMLGKESFGAAGVASSAANAVTDVPHSIKATKLADRIDFNFLHFILFLLY